MSAKLKNHSYFSKISDETLTKEYDFVFMNQERKQVIFGMQNFFLPKLKSVRPSIDLNATPQEDDYTPKLKLVRLSILIAFV